MTPKYVAEYDGLRAIAVLGVLLFHFGFKSISGGFVGVDVFFVISGFLISKIIFTDIANSSFSLLNFYGRRFRRILPALAVTLLISSLIFGALQFPQEMRVQNASLYSALASLSNVYFYFTTDYFSNNATNPFLHTWSLSVEEQFYLAFPLLAIAIRRFDIAKKRILILLLLFVSFVASSVYVYIDASAAFYLPWFRAWELLAGSAVSLFSFDNVPRVLKRIASYVGPSIIVSAFFLFNEKLVFPGLAAAIPVIGAVLTIFGAGSGGYANKVLGASIPVFVGRISYSLYLIHWPVVCAFAIVGIQANGIKRIIALAICIAFAYISFRFVEQPFRKFKPSSEKSVYVAAFSAIFFVGVAGTLVEKASSTIWEGSPRAYEFTQPALYSHDHLGNQSCFLTSGKNDINLFDKQACLEIDPKRGNVLLMGDSHSAHFAKSIKNLYPDKNVLQASASGCVPISGEPGELRCTLLFKFMYEDWLPKNASRLDAVILSARWEAAHTDGLVKLNDDLIRWGGHLTVLGPSPEYQIDFPKILAYKEIYGIDLSRQLLKTARVKIDDQLSEMLPKDFSYLSIMKNVCSSDMNCVQRANNVPVLFDKDHFTLPGADLALTGLPRCLEKPAYLCKR